MKYDSPERVTWVVTWCTRCKSLKFFFYLVHLHGTLTLLPQVDYWLKLFTVVLVVVVLHRRVLYFVSNNNSINQNIVENTVAKRTDLNPPCIFKNKEIQVSGLATV